MNESSNIIIYGCGGHARSVINVICETNIKKEILLVDHNARDDETILGFKTQRQYMLNANDDYIIALGDNNTRAQLYHKLSDMQLGHCISVISTFAHLGLNTKIGLGTFVAPNVYIGPQATIGNNTIINTGSIVEHEVSIGNNTHIAPHATICGRTKIGNNVFCGAGSVIIDNVFICDNVTIGAGAVVKENIVESGTYVGIPTRKIYNKNKIHEEA